MLRKTLHITLFLSLFISIAYANSNPKSEEISFEKIEGLMIVQANINGKLGQYIFDTGCQYLLINTDQNQLKESKEKTYFDNLSRTLEASVSRFNALSLGPIQKNNLTAFEVDLSFVEAKIGVEIDGIIGSSILHEQSIFIDYKNAKLFFDAKNLNASLVKNYRIVDYPITKCDVSGLPIVAFNNGKRDFYFGIDSGSNGCHISQKNSKTIKQFLNATGKQDELTGEIIFNELKVEAIPFSKTDLSSIDTQFGKLDGILSPTALNVDKIMIDFDRGKIYFFVVDFSLAD